MAKCDSYHTRETRRYTYDQYTGEPIAHKVTIGICYGTFECEECKCGGDRSKCDFYPENKTK